MHTATKQDRGSVLEDIMRRHNRLLYRVVRNMVPSDAEAEDIVQETYVRAFTALDGFSGRGRISTWLVRIAINETLERRRKARVTEDIETVENVISISARVAPGGLTQPPATPEQTAARNEIRRYLESAIARLPEDQRAVFVLRGIQEFSTAETAEILDLPEATVKTRLHRAKGRLKSLLDSDFQDALKDTHPFAGARCDRMVRNVLNRISPPLR